jgi:hypothetical protein
LDNPQLVQCSSLVVAAVELALMVLPEAQVVLVAALLDREPNPPVMRELLSLVVEAVVLVMTILTKLVPQKWCRRHQEEPVVQA